MGEGMYMLCDELAVRAKILGSTNGNAVEQTEQSAGTDTCT